MYCPFGPTPYDWLLAPIVGAWYWLAKRKQRRQQQEDAQFEEELKTGLTDSKVTISAVSPCKDYYVNYAYRLHGRYYANLRNDKASLSKMIETDSKAELEREAVITYKLWTKQDRGSR